MRLQDVNFSDAQQAYSFLQPQLLKIEAGLIMKKYPSYNYEDFAFVNESGDMWDVGTIFYTGDIAGKVEWIAGKGYDIPKVGMTRESGFNMFHLAGIGYEWTTQELKRAQKLGIDEFEIKPAGAKKLAQKFKYDMFMRGHTEKGKTGLLNDASVPTGLVPNDGTGSARTFASKTDAFVLRDLNELINAPYNSTLEIEDVDTVVLPPTLIQEMNLRQIPNTSETLWSYFMKNNSYTARTGRQLKIKSSRELETAGASGTRRMIAYRNEREVVQFHLPGDHEFLEPFRRGSMHWEVDGIMNIGGTEIRLPKAMVYRDGM